MLPSELLSMVAVLMLLAPGCVWAVVRRNPRANPVHQGAAILLVGLLCTALSLGVIAVLRSTQPSFVMDFGAWVRSGDYYLHRSYEEILRTIGIELGVACVLAGVIALIANERSHVRGERADAPLLVRLIEGEEANTRVQPGTHPRVFARTHDGSLYQGTLYGLDSGSSAEQPVLVLSAPIAFQRPGEPSSAMPALWDRLAIPLGDVAELWTSSRIAEQASPAAAGSADADGAGDHEERASRLVSVSTG